MNAKQKRFVDEYVKDFNQTKAARRAGYGAKHANVHAHKLMKKPEIKAAIEAKREKVAEENDVTVSWIVERMKRIADFDIRKLFNKDGTLKQAHELDESTAAGVAALELEISGSDGSQVTTAKVRTRDTLRALDGLARYKGMYSDAPIMPPADPMNDRTRIETLKLVQTMLGLMARGQLMKPPIVIEHQPKKVNGSGSGHA